jgi:hypothetical protein
MFFDQIIKGLLVFAIVAKQSGKEGLLLTFFVEILIEQFFDAHHFFVKGIHFLLEGLQVDVLVPIGDFLELFIQHLKISTEYSALLSVERLMIIDEIFRILDPLLKSWYQLLR